MSSKYYDHTKYPNLFKNTYWGWFTYNPPIDLTLTPIFENRNAFVEQHKLKKVLSKSSFKIKLLINYDFDCKKEEYIKSYKYATINSILNGFKYDRHINYITADYSDHVEVYETTDKDIIVVSSPYMKKDDTYIEFLNKSGFIDTNQLYSDSALTFYKKYTREEYNNIENKYKSLIKQVKTEQKNPT